MTHDLAVLEQAAQAEVAVPVVTRCARQGDLLVRRIGDSSTEMGSPTPPTGITVAAGSHGEHRLVADAYHREPVQGQMIIDLPQGGTIYHTDVPAARHGAVELCPGRWEMMGQQEMGLDQVVRPVRD